MENRNQNINPFISLIIIFLTLFSALFIKMEVRRVGYSIVKLSEEIKKSKNELRNKRIELAHLTKPSYINEVVNKKSTLKRGIHLQYIHVANIYSKKWSESP